MSAASGIGVSTDLATKFSDAVANDSVRFLKVSIRDESLVYDLSINKSDSFNKDLAKLQQKDILEENEPAYILAKLDTPLSEWITIYYVPDSAKVRDKMLYAATRASLLKSLGSTLFVDSIFATSKADITEESYIAHLRHVAAPKPLSSREQELADLRAAENTAASYEGSKGRASHIGTGVGLKWSLNVEDAILELGKGERSAVVVIGIDPQSETLILKSTAPTDADSVGAALPESEPCYAFFLWERTTGETQTREIVFIYSCPSNSPIKHRMLYSSGSVTTYQSAKLLLQSASLTSLEFASRKIETAEPREVNETFLKLELGVDIHSERPLTTTTSPANNFAKPRGPTKRR